MKQYQLSKFRKIIALFAISCFFMNGAMAQIVQPTVTITVKAKPTGTISGTETVCTQNAIVYTLDTLSNSATTDTVTLTTWRVVSKTGTASGVVQPGSTIRGANIIFSNTNVTSLGGDTVYVIADFYNKVSLCTNSDTLQVAVNPNSSIAFTGSPTNVCSEKANNFNVETTNATNIAWSVNPLSSGITSTISDPTGNPSTVITFVNNSTTVDTVWVKVNYTNTLAPSCTYADSIKVAVAPSPNATIVDISGAAGRTTICPDSSATAGTFAAQYKINAPIITSPATTITDTSWSVNLLTSTGVTAGIDDLGKLSVSNTSTTDQTIRIIATYYINNGICDGAAYADTLEITIHPTPQATLISDATICNQQSVTLTAELTSGTVGAGWSFNWASNIAQNQDGTVATTATNPVAFEVTPNTVATTVTYGLTRIADGNGCVTTFSRPANP